LARFLQNLVQARTDGSTQIRVQELHDMFDRIDIQRITAATIGALILSVAAIISTSAPAGAAAPAGSAPCACNVVFLAK
jgi:hypothetical protein